MKIAKFIKTVNEIRRENKRFSYCAYVQGVWVRIEFKKCYIRRIELNGNGGIYVYSRLAAQTVKEFNAYLQRALTNPYFS